MRRRVDIWRFPGTRAVALAGLVFLYVPITALFVLSFNAGETVAAWEGFSLRWYAAIFESRDLVGAIRNSLVVAVVATIVGTGVATLAALANAPAPWRGRGVAEGVIGLPLVVPDIVAAIALLLLLIMAHVPLGVVSIMLAHCAHVVPFAYLPVRARLQGLDRSLGEAAADLYASPARTFLRVTLPLIWPAVAAAALLAFIGSLGEFIVSFFVSGPGATTLPVYVFGMVRMGITPVVNAVSVVLLVTPILLLAVVYLIGRRRGVDVSRQPS